MAKISKLTQNIRIALLITLCFVSLARGADMAIVVTQVEVTTIGPLDKIAKIILNENLLLDEIKVITASKTNVIKLNYPDYQSKSGQSIPQISILDKGLSETIRQAIISAHPSSKKINTLSYKIAKINLFKQEKSSLKAFVEVIFNNAVMVEARVMDSKNGLWIAWPSRKDKDGKWIKQFDILNYNLKHNIEKFIIEKYKVVLSEEP